MIAYLSLAASMMLVGSYVGLSKLLVAVFPVFLLAIAVVAALGPTVPNLILTIAIVYTPTLARVVRGPVLSVKRWDHVEAARSVGVGEFAIATRHVLPMVISPILVQTSLTLANTIFTVTALSFLGIGPPPPDPTFSSAPKPTSTGSENPNRIPENPIKKHSRPQFPRLS